MGFLLYVLLIFWVVCCVLLKILVFLGDWENVCLGGSDGSDGKWW